MSENIFTELYNRVISLFRQTENNQEDAKSVACNRLRVVLMQDRTNITPELLQRMRKELVDLLSKYVEMDKEALELNIEQEGEQMALMLSIPVIRAKDEAEIEQNTDSSVTEDDEENEDDNENDGLVGGEEEKEENSEDKVADNSEEEESSSSAQKENKEETEEEEKGEENVSEAEVSQEEQQQEEKTEKKSATEVSLTPKSEQPAPQKDKSNKKEKGKET